MKQTKEKEELQSRREFLKKSAKGALPILGISLFGPSILSSCGGDGDNKSGGCGNSCSGSCQSGCSGSCSGECSGSCDGCTGGCDSTSCKYM
ncbi:MAG: hypothetical protein IJ069_01245 [Prevotella sp.]|nr:hypothetical protein [Prevotella sp.]MBQ8152292.1 hypothetical protein [Prevotella sp.]MBQ8715102.1 hypothetical protein [Prevotella sp.]